MSEIIAVTGAVTVAQRLRRELERAGCIQTSVIHTPGEFNKGGCSYSIRTDDSCLLTLLQISRDKKIKLKRVLREKQTEDGREYYDIS